MRYALLDLIRSLAVFSIVIYHVSIRMKYFFAQSFSVLPNIYNIDLGSVAVSILIILSGLVLTLEYKSKNLIFKHYILKRLLRVYSVYILIFLFALVLFFIINTGYYIQTLEFACTLTGFCALIGMWGQTPPTSLFSLLITSWFIGLIVVLYFLFPFLLKYIKKYKFYALLFLLIISLYSSLFIIISPLFDIAGLMWFPINRLFEFGLGIYLGLFLKPAVWSVLNRNIKWNNFLKFTGEISFPLFLVHYPLLYIYFDLLRKIGVNIVLALILYLAVSVWASWFFLRLSKIILRKFNYSSI